MLQAGPISSLKSFFRFPFEGPEAANRFAVGAALVLAGMFVPIIPCIFVAGYLLRIGRRAIKGEELALPAWDEWGRLFVDGLRLGLAGLVFILPGLLVIAAGMAFYFYSVLAMQTASPYMGSEAEAGLAVQFLGGMASMFLSMSVGYAALVLGAIPMTVGLAHLVAEDRFAAAFHVRQWWPILWKNKLSYLVTWLLVAGLAMVSNLAVMMTGYSMILCCFVPILMAPLGFYLALVGSALFGQAYREGVAVPAVAMV